MSTYKELMEEADALEVQAHELREQAEKEHARARRKTSIEVWLDYRFASSSGLTSEFAEFAEHYRYALCKILCPDFELINFKKGHFEVSAFFCNATTGKYIYISAPDVRYFPNEWYHMILIREAEHEKDYTGGDNHITSMKQLYYWANLLTAKERVCHEPR